MTIPVAKAEVISILVQVFVYIGYVVLFSTCLWIILTKKTTNRVLFLASSSSFFLCSVCFILNLRCYLNNFAEVEDDPYVAIYTSKGSQVGLVTSMSNLISRCVEMLNYIIADSILIWRCFAVWDRNVLVCLPSALLLTGTIVSGIYTLVYMTKSPPPSPWGNSTMAFLIATNILTTALISSRIWFQKRVYEHVFGSHTRYTKYYHFVLALVIETGLIYTSTLIITLVVYMFLYDSIFVIIEHTQTLIAGIMPTLIIAYVSFYKSIDNTDATPSPVSDARFASSAVEIGPKRLESFDPHMEVRNRPHSVGGSRELLET